MLKLLHHGNAFKVLKLAHIYLENITIFNTGFILICITLSFDFRELDDIDAENNFAK